MNEHDKENMLQRKRDYKKKMRTQSAGDLAKETLHTVQNDIEYDGALFEPINNQSDEGVFIFFFSNKKSMFSFFPTKKHVYFILFYFDNTLSQCVLYLIVGPNIMQRTIWRHLVLWILMIFLMTKRPGSTLVKVNLFCVALSSKLILVKVKFINVV